jgi:hypothetical protein
LDELQTAMAVKLFEMKRLSSGQAALLTDIDRTAFLMRLADSGVAMIDLQRNWRTTFAMPAPSDLRTSRVSSTNHP